MKLGVIIRTLRLQKNLTLEILAERAAIDSGYLGKIERLERMPSIEMLEQIAQALGTQVSTICAAAEAESDPAATVITDDLALRREYLLLTLANRQLALGIIKTIKRNQQETPI